MNVKEYISSGIVESYVLGLATPEEQREFERNCAEYPEILDARIAFEESLELQAMQHAVTPPADLRSAVLASFEAGDTPTPVVSLPDTTSARKNGWLRFVSAAAVLLLIGSVIWNISLQRQTQQTQRDLATLRNSYDTSVAKLNELQGQLALLTGNPNVKMAAMKGLQPAPHALATVYWDSTSKDVYLMVNNLPQPTSDKQYQLWALLDGKPIDLGLIPNEYFIGEKKLLLTMKNTVGAQAFAITLEQKGGSTAGPQGVMYTLGNL